MDYTTTKNYIAILDQDNKNVISGINYVKIGSQASTIFNFVETDTLESMINQLLQNGYKNFDCAFELTGTDIDPILRVPVYQDNILTRYENGDPVYEDHILTGYIEYPDPDKQYYADKWNWITEAELKIRLTSGYKPIDYIFSAKILAKKVKKNQPFYDFAVSLNNQNTPQKT